jgi:hypothetical protein
MIIGEKNTDLKRLIRATKASFFDRNWAISLFGEPCTEIN